MDAGMTTIDEIGATGQLIAIKGRDGGVSVVRRYGQGEVPHLFIHGFAEGSYVWRRTISRLPADACAYTLDLRGHGESDWCENGQYETVNHVHDTLHVMDVLGFDRVILIGHSLGGKVAARVAALCRERVAGLIIVDTEPDADPVAKAHVGNALQASLQQYDSVAQYAEQLVATRPLAPVALLTELARDALRPIKNGKFELRADPRLVTSYPFEESGAEVWDSLARVNCPSLIVRGAYSGILSSSSAQRIVSHMRDATLAIVAAAGHSVMIDNAEGFQAAIEAFLGKLREASLCYAKASQEPSRSSQS